MIPPTKNGLNTMALVSMMQKAIRRGLEVQAMQAAVEIHQTSRAFCTMICNRLQVIAHEDSDCLSAPWIVPFVRTATAQAVEWYDAAKLGRSRMPIGNAIRMLARGPKSRTGDHFQAAVGLAAELEGFVPTIPEWTADNHTLAGKRQGRGLEYFRTVSTVLIPPPAELDLYEAEAYRLWAVRDACKSGVGGSRLTKHKHAARSSTQQTALDLADLEPQTRKAKK
jgi:hypothetical protein